MAVGCCSQFFSRLRLTMIIRQYCAIDVVNSEFAAGLLDAGSFTAVTIILS